MAIHSHLDGTACRFECPANPQHAWFMGVLAANEHAARPHPTDEVGPGAYTPYGVEDDRAHGFDASQIGTSAHGQMDEFTRWLTIKPLDAWPRAVESVLENVLLDRDHVDEVTKLILEVLGWRGTTSSPTIGPSPAPAAGEDSASAASTPPG